MKPAFSLAGAVLAAIAASTNAQSPPVKVSLRSSWPEPPILAEILETVSLENPDAFFPYLDLLSDSDILSSPTSPSPEAIHQAALQIAGDNGLLEEPGAPAMAQMNLGLHSATPKLEAFYNYYRDQHANSSGTSCGSWVDWYGEVVCDVETLIRLAGLEALDPNELASKPATRPKILTFDHIFPPPDHILERPPRTAILYASLTSPNFQGLHKYLLKLVNQPEPRVEYIFRHIPPQTPSTGQNFLSGYGVALDLKKMDYLALDDRGSNNQRSNVASSKHRDGSLDDPLQRLILAHPENSSIDASVPLTEDEIRVLGGRAVQLIADSPEPLNTLIQLSQNFPKYVTSLARRVVVNENIAEELRDNSLKVQQGMNAFWVNGLQADQKEIHAFGLLSLLKKERGVIQSLTSQGFSGAQAFELLTHPAIAASQKNSEVLEAIFDASDRPEGGDVIVWWNDLEKDSRYASWSPSLYALLRPSFPGQMPSTRANLFNVILMLDLAQTTSLNFIAGPMAGVLNRGYPIRFGVVPLAETEEGKKMARLFYHLIKAYGRKKTLELFQALSQIQLPPHMQTPAVDWTTVRDSYDLLAEAEAESNPEAAAPSLDDILNGKLEAGAPFDKIGAYTDRLGATLSTSPMGHAFFNGKHFDMNDDFLRHLQLEVNQQMNFFQEKIYEGSLSDANKPESMGDYLYDLPTTNKRRNKYIFPSNAPGSLRIVNLPQLFKLTRFRVSSSSYVYPVDASSTLESLFVVADLDSKAGLGLVKEALGSLTSTSKTRISFIHNPTSSKGSQPRSPASWLMSHLHHNELLSKTTPTMLLAALGLDAEDVTVETGKSQDHVSKASAFEQLTGGTRLDDLKDDVYAEYVKSCRLIARQLQLSAGESALVANGRVVGPIGPSDFRAADFDTLEEYEHRRRTNSIAEAVTAVAPESADDKLWFADAVSMVSSVIASSQLPDPSETGLFDAPVKPRQRTYELLDSKYTSFQYGDNSTALYHIAVIVDPLSEIAQKWSSLLQWLRNIPDVFIEIHLNPGRYPEMPLKRFYQYNLVPTLSFNDAGLEVPSTAIFKDLPIDPIYTLAMDVPTSWLVRPREALYDLDNIQLGKLFPGDIAVEAIFDLDNLVIEGHAREAAVNGAPRGVQLQLATSDATPVDDTQVVANLGYFQFKAKPGVFRLEIRKGQGSKIYQLESAGNEGWDSPTVREAGKEITLTSFEGLTLYPRLARNPGMETADVLEEEDEEDGGPSFFEHISSKVTSLFGLSKENPTSTDLISVKQQADINIFTVASGLLYERFVGIMILSVLRNTNSTVKFWFIENFLSPSFLEFIPHMAEKYNFQYELVTYKWPSWLRAQKEKQRIIWAYKILFLDVLFPMDLKKVIFVDADQIVRADLQELVDLDLHGAPYGYTPMGDDNTDMEGFRFWKTGYWRDFLEGRPYHISALYVIDLVRFRQLAAGDILRGQYQQLSADPNSLANLDQDLPNNLQKQVPIYSLHEDWLWCETWCSKDRLHKAKTIDLCQNPLTKEPKLARARQIPEWEEYDAEIGRLSKDLAAEGKIHSRMATADANVLAGAGTSGAANSEGSTTEATAGDQDEEDGSDVTAEPQHDEL